VQNARTAIATAASGDSARSTLNNSLPCLGGPTLRSGVGGAGNPFRARRPEIHFAAGPDITALSAEKAEIRLLVQRAADRASRSSAGLVLRGEGKGSPATFATPKGLKPACPWKRHWLADGSLTPEASAPLLEGFRLEPKLNRLLAGIPADPPQLNPCWNAGSGRQAAMARPCASTSQRPPSSRDSCPGFQQQALQAQTAASACSQRCLTAQRVRGRRRHQKSPGIPG